MSVYKRPGSKYYWTKFELNGKRIHKSTKTYRWQMIDRVPQISLLKGERQKDTVLVCPNAGTAPEPTPRSH